MGCGRFRHRRTRALFDHTGSFDRISAPPGRHHARLVVNQTTTTGMASQQARKTGQMIPYDRKVH